MTAQRGTIVILDFPQGPGEATPCRRDPVRSQQRSTDQQHLRDGYFKHPPGNVGGEPGARRPDDGRGTIERPLARLCH